MYDCLTGRFTFACPSHGEAKVALSSFRRLERLPGSAHPAVFSVRFACTCGGEHGTAVAHDDLDWATLGLRSGTFLNLMTSARDSVAAELADLAARRIEGGTWPWSFFCYPEERPRPIFPSSLFLLAPGSGPWLGIAVRCPGCESVSINLVSREHVDVAFHHDAEIGVIAHVFRADAASALERFRAELYSASFDTRRLALD